MKIGVHSGDGRDTSVSEKYLRVKGYVFSIDHVRTNHSAEFFGMLNRQYQEYMDDKVITVSTEECDQRTRQTLEGKTIN